MDIDVQKVIEMYKEELANTKDEVILRRVLQSQLEMENSELKQRIAELESKLGGE